MSLNVDFEFVRIIVASCMFASACYFDIKKREVSDWLWVIFAAAAGILYVFDFPANINEGVIIMASMGLSAAVAYGIYRAGLFGGADMLALITFSGLVPLSLSSTLLGSAPAAFHSFAPLTMLTNAIILSVVHIVFNVLRNLNYYSKHQGLLFEGLEHEPALKKAFAVMVGHRSANPQYAFPIERTSNGKREFDFALKPAETAEYEVRKDVWVTSGIPFLVYFAAGFVVMIFAGDIFAILLGR